MLEWISVNDHLPAPGMLVLAFREPWPSFYWMGEYTGVPSEDEDMFDWWIPLPEIPEETK